MSVDNQDNAEQPPEEAPAMRNERREDTARSRLNAPVSIVIDDLNQERVGSGTANLRDLSLHGALITDVQLSNGRSLDPDAQYVLRFRLMAGPLAGMEALCRSVRFDASVGGFGVRIPDGFKLPIL